jgi:hypothetical protein
MAEDERPEPGAGGENREPSLELPSLRSAFRRRRPRKDSSRPPATRAASPRFPEQQPRQAPAPLVTTPAAPLVAEPTAAEPTAAEPAVADPVPEAEPRLRRRRSIQGHLPGPIAALLTGAVVGLALVGLTAASRHLCTSWRGTSSCGDPGILLLLAISVAAVVLGVVLLRALGVAAPVGTGLLGTGLLIVLLLLWLAVGGDGAPAVVGVPLLAMLTHLAAWWLTTTYVEPGDRPR